MKNIILILFCLFSSNLWAVTYLSENPRAPKNLKFSLTSANSVKVVWEQPESKNKIHAFNAFVNGKFHSTIKLNELNLTNLKLNKDYSVFLVAIDWRIKYSPKSNNLKFRLDSGVRVDNKPPSAPKKLTTDLSGKSIQLRWKASSDNKGVSSYRIYRNNVYITTVSNLNYLDSSVSVGNTYSYNVNAVDKAGNKSKRSSVSSIKVEEPDNGLSKTPLAPINLKYVKLSDSSVLVKWGVIESKYPITRYNVYSNDKYITTVTSREFNLKGLEVNNDYIFQVVSIDSKTSFSPYSQELKIKIEGDSGPVPSDIPLSPINLTFNQLSGDSLKVSWETIDSKYSLKGYNVYLNNKYKTTVNKKEVILYDLNINQDYQVTLVSIDSKTQFSKYSKPIIVRTKGDTGGTIDPNLPDEIKKNYKLVFSDEFNGNSLNTKLWNTQYIWGPNTIINNELQYYVDIKNDPNFGVTPFKMDGNNLNITALKTPNNLKGKAKNQPYLSGAMTTWDSFRATYGYFEVRAKLPVGQGLWGAFWLLHVDQNKGRPEIDIMENLGHDPNLIYNTYHYRVWKDNAWDYRRTPSYKVPGPNYSKDFHTYSVKWEPGLIVWYVDGVEKHKFKSKDVTNEELYILLNLAVGGGWPGNPSGSTVFPNTYKVDYVRAYKKK